MFLGTGSNSIILENLHCVCPHCQSFDTTIAHIEQNYISVVFVPFIPFRKSGSTICTACNTTLLPKKMPTEMRTAFNEAKKKGRADWWMFSGLAIFTILFIIGWINSMGIDNRSRELILSPKYGDIYTIHMDREYMNLQLISSSGTVSSFFPGHYTSSKKSGIGLLEIAHPNDMFDTGTTMSYTQSGLIEMLDNSTLVGVRRVDDVIGGTQIK